jgi:hypothetical protein
MKFLKTLSKLNEILGADKLEHAKLFLLTSFGRRDLY